MQKLLFKDAYDSYINYISARLKPTTVLGIKLKFNNHILPIWGNKNIYTLCNNDFIIWQNYIVNLGFGNSFNSQVFSAINQFFKFLKRFYDIENLALKFGNFNNFLSEEKKELQVWTLKEYKKFIKVVNEPIYHALFNCLFFCGLRKGEALALKFSDIQDNYLIINKTLTKELFNGKRLELTPKTKKSIRKLRIDKKLRSELKGLQDYYNKKFGFCNNDFYVFGGLKPIPTTTLERKKNNYCKISGVKQIRIHDFRHSHATMLYNKKINPKYIQLRLGHSSITTTLNTYVHSNEKYEKKVYKILNFLRLFI